MFDFLKRNREKVKFDKKVLRKNDISILILDERWNGLFANIKKSSGISGCEEKLKGQLKEQARILAEIKKITIRKKSCMDRIINLTTEAFDNDNNQAKDEMHACEKEIKKINERIGQLEEEKERIPDDIRETNLELLEHTVNLVYFKIRSDQKRVRVLETLIEETRSKLKGYIDEKESLSRNVSDIYSYFHDLLGGEELERLEKEFFE